MTDDKPVNYEHLICVCTECKTQLEETIIDLKKIIAKIKKR